jgi:hypothetical protein
MILKIVETLPHPPPLSRHRRRVNRVKMLCHHRRDNILIMFHVEQFKNYLLSISTIKING